MNDNFLLCEELTDFQLKLLSLIQFLRAELRGTKTTTHKSGEPLMTIQYGYVVAILGCSHSSVSDGIQKLIDIGLLIRISNNYGECATYQYNLSVYKSLIKEAKKRNCTLTTGRKKQHREVSTETVLKYMTGKAITKAKKQTSLNKYNTSSSIIAKESV